MRILHTESSSGWGGQEIRILKESLGLQERGHEFFFAVAKGGVLVHKAREKGFYVLELPFKKFYVLFTLVKLIWMIRRFKIDLLVTHSSLDAWMGGIAARLARCPVIRMRHLSTQIRPGLNSKLLYKTLADFVVTTSTSAAEQIQKQANILASQCVCIPTGVNTQELVVDQNAVLEFRKKYKIAPEHFLVGTACFVRSWKGIEDLLKAAALLKHKKEIKWLVIGGGFVDRYKPRAQELGIQENVIFTGHLEPPYSAMAALDVFLLLSTNHEGVSQALLQAAYLEKPLVTTPVGGLPEVCLDHKTGLVVPAFSPEKVKDAVQKLIENGDLRQELGKNGKRLVQEKFSFSSMLDQMEKIYRDGVVSCACL